MLQKCKVYVRLIDGWGNNLGVIYSYKLSSRSVLGDKGVEEENVNE